MRMELARLKRLLRGAGLRQRDLRGSSGVGVPGGGLHSEALRLRTVSLGLQPPTQKAHFVRPDQGRPEGTRVLQAYMGYS